MTASLLSLKAISALLGDCPNRATLAKRVHQHLSRELGAPTQLNGHPSRGTRQPHTAFPALGSLPNGDTTWGCQERRCKASGTATSEREAHGLWHEHHSTHHPTVKLTTVEAAALAGNHPPKDARRTHIRLLAVALGNGDHEACLRHCDALDKLDETDDQPTGECCWAMDRVGRDEPIYRRTEYNGTKYGLSRWAYRFLADNDRMPTEGECRLHAAGHRVYVSA